MDGPAMILSGEEWRRGKRDMMVAVCDVVEIRINTSRKSRDRSSSLPRCRCFQRPKFLLSYIDHGLGMDVMFNGRPL